MINPEDYKKPEYMNHPIVGKYMDRFFFLVDDLYQETDDKPMDEEVSMLKTILRVVFSRIAIDGEMTELDDILHMHFPIEYEPETGDSIPSLTGYPLSTSN